MNVTPGEPVPPGYEEELKHTSHIQHTIDQCNGHVLIGLEYTVELQEDGCHESNYICVLCDKRGDARNIMQHWISFNHRMKYLEKHYPTAIRESLLIKYQPNSHNTMLLITQALAKAVESYHGRLTVTVMNADEFRRKKSYYIEEICNKYHFNERKGPNFVNVVESSLWESKSEKRRDQTQQQNANKTAAKQKDKNINQIKQNSNKIDFDDISSESDNDNLPSKKSKSKHYQHTDEDRSKLVEKRLPTPKELSLQASQIAQEKYKWEKYRCLLDMQLKSLEKQYKEYEKNPEKHPLYNEEWKKFWNRRYKELQTKKKVDPNTYDYKPEWVIYWTDRTKVLYENEIENKKKEIKLKLGLSEDAEENVEHLKQKYKLTVSRKSMPTKTAHDTSNADVINISDDETPHCSKQLYSRQVNSRSPSSRDNRFHDYKRRSSHSSRTRSRSISPLTEDFEVASNKRNYSHRQYSNSSSYYGYSHSRYPAMAASHYSNSSSSHYRILDSHHMPKYERDGYSDESKNYSNSEDKFDGPLSVVAVLRLLTALEEHLGSLGPKVIDLLGKALAMEKVKPNSSDDLLLNEDNCVFFETIKEKLKGLLIADVLDDQQKIRAVKRTVRNIAAIVHQVATKERNESLSSESQSPLGHLDSDVAAAVLSNIDGSNDDPDEISIDRHVIASKLSVILQAEGRIDISMNEMDKLIHMFILMIQLSVDNRNVNGKELNFKDIISEMGVECKVEMDSTKTPAELTTLPRIVDEIFEKELTSLVQEVEKDIKNDSKDKEAKGESSSTMLESLTDSDLQTLLQNFKHLSSEEQHHLIAHLKKLETADPLRVENLRRYVNLAVSNDAADSSDTILKTKDDLNSTTFDSESQTSTKKARLDIGNDSVANVNPNKFSLDDEDEDDDYNFDEVFKAASSNVKNLSKNDMHPRSSSTLEGINEKISNQSPKRNLDISLNDTESLIANLMGSLQQSNATAKILNANKSTEDLVATEARNTKAAECQSLNIHNNMTNDGCSATSIPLNVSNAPSNSYYQQSSADYVDNNTQNQTNPNPPTNFFNTMHIPGSSYSDYQSWNSTVQQISPQQQYNMQNFTLASQQQSQQLPYNMFGGSSGK